MAQRVIGVFDRFLNAEDALDALKEAGFESNCISIVARQDKASEHVKRNDTGAGIGAGAAIGGIAGLIAGLAALAVPGIGAVIIGGPLGAALGGLGVGAAAGSITGALTGMNIPEDDANYYAETVRNGGALLLVDSSDTAAARDILQTHGAVRVTEGSATEPRA